MSTNLPCSSCQLLSLTHFPCAESFYLALITLDSTVSISPAISIIRAHPLGTQNHSRHIHEKYLSLLLCAPSAV